MDKESLRKENKLLKAQLKAERKKNAMLESRIEALSSTYTAKNLNEDFTQLLQETEEMKQKYADAVKEARIMIKKYSKEFERLNTQVKHKGV